LATSANPGEKVEVEAILDAMERRQDEIAAAVVARLVTEVDGYQLWQSNDLSSQLVEHCRQHIRLLLSMARTGRPPRSADLEFVRQVGVRRADELSPLHTLLHGYRVGQRVFWEWIVRQTAPTPQGLCAALRLTATCFDYMDVVSTAVVTAYLRRSQRLELEADRLRVRLLEDLLAGRVASRQRAAARARAMGLDPGAACVVAVAVLRPPTSAEPDGLRRVAEALARHAGTRRPPFVVARHHEVVGVIGIEPHGLTRTRQQIVDALVHHVLDRQPTRMQRIAEQQACPVAGVQVGAARFEVRRHDGPKWKRIGSGVKGTPSNSARSRCRWRAASCTRACSR
jgi:hypothetical protein